MNLYDFDRHVNMVCDFEPSSDLTNDENANLSDLGIVINVEHSVERKQKILNWVKTLKHTSFQGCRWKKCYITSHISK